MRINSIETEIWSSPDENHKVRHLGMMKQGELFRRLKIVLENMGLLPDEYFLGEGMEVENGKELPDYEYAECIPSYGGSEGIYLDIILVYRDADGELKRKHIATGKTLDESVDAFFQMSITATVCSLLLNGRGRIYQSEGAILLLSSDEKAFLIRHLESSHYLSSKIEKQDSKKVLNKLQCGVNSSRKVD